MNYMSKFLLIKNRVLPGNPAFIKMSPVKVTELTPNWYTGTKRSINTRIS